MYIERVIIKIVKLPGKFDLYAIALLILIGNCYITRRYLLHGLQYKIKTGIFSYIYIGIENVKKKHRLNLQYTFTQLYNTLNTNTIVLNWAVWGVS